MMDMKNSKNRNKDEAEKPSNKVEKFSASGEKFTPMDKIKVR